MAENTPVHGLFWQKFMIRNNVCYFDIAFTNGRSKKILSCIPFLNAQHDEKPHEASTKSNWV